ncbi:hypothetical protein [Fluviispira sanaruensis]|uniref:Uncharacterized protein n=1 Tax=Fluviispira sanaruensis TaxID=2493639 RepID=A0A4P2VNN7_FLUSA|nr:hypothetical protein [Fluviispira sanaruensis]BBH53660.1 hypothetical protein JCM31447_21070 [Fluviispira sanaruensis]
MDIFATVSLVFSGVVLLLCAWLVLSKQKVSLKVIELNNKLVALEARELTHIAPKVIANVEKKIAPAKAQVHEHTSNHTSELLDLRKEVSKLKDENKKAKEELRNKEKELKGQAESTVNKLYSLTEENTKLIEQMRSLDQQLKAALDFGKNKVSLQDFENKIVEINGLRDDLSKAKHKNIELEKSLKHSTHKLSTHLDKLKNLEIELQKWQEAATTSDGKALDASAFLRWHDRAVTGRKMYRLMRQMRELSDTKVSTYQEGVVALSKWILAQKNLTPPSLSENEIQADRLLAEAWNAILNTETTANSSSGANSAAMN